MTRSILFCLFIVVYSCKESTQQKQVLPKVSTVADSVKSHSKYEQYIYNPETKTSNFSYNYSGIWDFDGDKKNDSIYFIGNDGAHVYFYLRIILSADGVVRDFPSVNMDFPLVANKESLEKWGKHPGVQFVVYDFDNNGIPDIYLNVHDPHAHDPYSPVPKDWRKQGVRTDYVVLSFAGNKLKAKDYFTKVQ